MTTLSYFDLDGLKFICAASAESVPRQGETLVFYKTHASCVEYTIREVVWAPQLNRVFALCALTKDARRATERMESLRQGGSP